MKDGIAKREERSNKYYKGGGAPAARVSAPREFLTDDDVIQMFSTIGRASVAKAQHTACPTRPGVVTAMREHSFGYRKPGDCLWPTASKEQRRRLFRHSAGGACEIAGDFLNSDFYPPPFPDAIDVPRP